MTRYDESDSNEPIGSTHTAPGCMSQLLSGFLRQVAATAGVKLNKVGSSQYDKVHRSYSHPPVAMPRSSGHASSATCNENAIAADRGTLAAAVSPKSAARMQTDGDTDAVSAAQHASSGRPVVTACTACRGGISTTNDDATNTHDKPGMLSSSHDHHNIMQQEACSTDYTRALTNITVYSSAVSGGPSFASSANKTPALHVTEDRSTSTSTATTSSTMTASSSIHNRGDDGCCVRIGAHCSDDNYGKDDGNNSVQRADTNQNQHQPATAQEQEDNADQRLQNRELGHISAAVLEVAAAEKVLAAPAQQPAQHTPPAQRQPELCSLRAALDAAGRAGLFATGPGGCLDYAAMLRVAADVAAELAAVHRLGAAHLNVNSR